MDAIIRCCGESVDLCATAVDDEAIETYTHWLNDQSASDYIGRSANVISKEDERRYIEDIPKNKRIHFCITNKNGSPIGLCEIIPDYHNGHASVVALIGEHTMRGHGYGSEAIRLMCEFAFKECRIHTVCARVNSYNEAAIKAFKKAGFAVCGTQHQYMFAHGEYHDVYIFEKINIPEFHK